MRKNKQLAEQKQSTPPCTAGRSHVYTQEMPFFFPRASSVESPRTPFFLFFLYSLGGKVSEFF